jgi:hypothetical protein
MTKNVGQRKHEKCRSWPSFWPGAKNDMFFGPPELKRLQHQRIIGNPFWAKNAHIEGPLGLDDGWVWHMGHLLGVSLGQKDSPRV